MKENYTDEKNKKAIVGSDSGFRHPFSIYLYMDKPYCPAGLVCIHYAVCSLPFIIAGHPFYLKNQYTCSSYIARILEENGIFVADKHFSLVTPKDFLKYEKMEKIYEGPLYQITTESFNYVKEQNSVYES